MYKKVILTRYPTALLSFQFCNWNCWCFRYITFDEYFKNKKYCNEKAEHIQRVKLHKSVNKNGRE